VVATSTAIDTATCSSKRRDGCSATTALATPIPDTIAIEATDDEIDPIIEECGAIRGRAIREVLHDLAALAIDDEASVSRGYVRGELLPFRL
jgi:hypothetical protein